MSVLFSASYKEVLTEDRNLLSRPVHPFVGGVKGLRIIAGIECNLSKKCPELWPS